MAYNPKLYDAPIPGENYTTNTKNFPWHRPPEFANYDDAVEACIEKILDEETSAKMLTMMELGYTVTDITTVFLLGGIGEGKWSVDIALLIAGPVSQIIRIMARGYDIEYEMGYETELPPTGAFFKALLSFGDELHDEDEEMPVEGAPTPQDGAMGDPGLAEDGSLGIDPMTNEAPPAEGGFMDSPEQDGGFM